MTTFFQAGTVMAFLHGVYDADCAFEHLGQKGDFGLGTVEAVDGEMIALDGDFYRIDKDGVAHLISKSHTTPFAVVNQFKAVAPIKVQHVANMNDLNQLIDAHLPTENIFYMIRIDGTFETMQLRSEACQPRPYQPLAETLPKLQKKFELRETTGTLAVSRCPKYSAGVTIAGYHYHYIDDARTTGGHVFDLTVKNATIMINPLRRFEMLLQDIPEFDEADLNIDVNEALKKIE